MRANSSISGLVVVLLALGGGCKPAEDPSVTIPTPRDDILRPAGPMGPPLPTDPEKLEELLRAVEQFRATQTDGPAQPVNELRERPLSNGAAQAEVQMVGSPSPPVQKLYFQCADDVTFAVRTVGRSLEVYPPDLPNNYVMLYQQPSEPGTYYYKADRAEFRFDGELATLVLGPDRWVDCVSNPAAAVWQAPARGFTR